MEKFHTYVLKSNSSGQLYIGQTKDVISRLKRHNSGYEKSTKGKGPWTMIWHYSFPTRSEAVKLERKLKGFKSRNRVLKFIEESQQ